MLPAPTTAFSPMVMPHIMVALEPIEAPFLMTVGTTCQSASVCSVPPVVDPYGEYAVEAALKVKDAKGGKITTVSLGTNLLRDVVKKPLSMGADELILLEDEAFVDGDSTDEIIIGMV